jgi:hypothetical protein
LPEEKERMGEEKGEKRWGCMKVREERKPIVYNLIIYRVSTVFPNALGNTVDAL